MKEYLRLLLVLCVSAALAPLMAILTLAMAFSPGAKWIKKMRPWLERPWFEEVFCTSCTLIFFAVAVLPAVLWFNRMVKGVV